MFGHRRIRANTSRRGFMLGATGSALLAMTGCRNESSGTGSLQTTWGERGIKKGQLQKPRAIAIDGDDQLYICDITARIQVFDRNGKYLRGWRTPESKNGRPTGLSVIGDTLYVPDTHYFRVLAYSLDGEMKDDLCFGEAGVEPGQIGWTTDVVADANGDLFVSEYGQTERVQKFKPGGEYLSGWGNFGTDIGSFQRPQSIAVDAKSQIWVCDAGNHRLQVFDASGKFVRSVGSEGSEPGQLSYPYGIAIDDKQQVYVCEYGNHRVQKMSADGIWLGDFGRPGSGPAEMHNPWSCVLDSKNCVHILDSWNHRVHRVRI